LGLPRIFVSPLFPSMRLAVTASVGDQCRATDAAAWARCGHGHGGQALVMMTVSVVVVMV
jgi:hypothetical protein